MAIWWWYWCPWASLPPKILRFTNSSSAKTTITQVKRRNTVACMSDEANLRLDEFCVTSKVLLLSKCLFGWNEWLETVFNLRNYYVNYFLSAFVTLPQFPHHVRDQVCGRTGGASVSLHHLFSSDTIIGKSLGYASSCGIDKVSFADCSLEPTSLGNGDGFPISQMAPNHPISSTRLFWL